MPCRACANSDKNSRRCYHLGGPLLSAGGVSGGADPAKPALVTPPGRPPPSPLPGLATTAGADAEGTGGVQNRGGGATVPAPDGGADPAPPPAIMLKELWAGIRTGGGAMRAARGSPESALAEEAPLGGTPYTLTGGAMRAANGSYASVVDPVVLGGAPPLGGPLLADPPPILAEGGGMLAGSAGEGLFGSCKEPLLLVLHPIFV